MTPEDAALDRTLRVAASEKLADMAQLWDDLVDSGYDDETMSMIATRVRALAADEPRMSSSIREAARRAGVQPSEYLQEKKAEFSIRQQRAAEWLRDYGITDIRQYRNDLRKAGVRPRDINLAARAMRSE